MTRRGSGIIGICALILYSLAAILSIAVFAFDLGNNPLSSSLAFVLGMPWGWATAQFAGDNPFWNSTLLTMPLVANISILYGVYKLLKRRRNTQ